MDYKIQRNWQELGIAPAHVLQSLTVRMTLEGTDFRLSYGRFVREKERSPLDTYRQGDILFVRQDEPEPHARAAVLIEAVKSRITNRAVIAEGEVTGHHHVAVAEQEFTIGEMIEQGQVTITWLQSETGVTVQHEEHAPVVLPPGKFRIVRQREYEYGSQAAHTIAD